MTIVRLNEREIQKEKKILMQGSCLLYLIQKKDLSYSIKYEFSTERITLMKEWSLKYWSKKGLKDYLRCEYLWSNTTAFPEQRIITED